MGSPIKGGTTNVSTTIRIVDSTTGLPETAVEHNTAGIDLWYRRDVDPGSTPLAKVSITEAALAALTTAHADGGIEHIGDGYYRLDLPDAAVAGGAVGVLVGGTVTGMMVIGNYHPLVDYDPNDSVRLGLTALPNAAADAAGGLAISDAGGLNLDGVATAAALATVDTVVDGIQTDLDNATDGLGALKTLIDTAQADLDTITGSDGVTLATAQALYAPAKAGDSMALSAGAITNASLAGNMEIVFETDFSTNYNATRNAWATNVQDFVGTSAADPFNGQVVSASVTGAVGSVAGNVDGNVTGSVGSNLELGPAEVNAECDTAITDAALATAASLATAQADLDTISDGIITGTAATGTLSTTVCTSSLTGYTDDQLIGRIITFLAGPADGESSDITDYASTNGTITFTALSLAPENGNAFKIT